MANKQNTQNNENVENVETILEGLLSKSNTKRARGSSVSSKEEQDHKCTAHITGAETLARNKKQSNKLRRHLVKRGYAVNDSGKSWRAISRFASDENSSSFGTVVITCQKEQDSKRRKVTVYKETVTIQA